ncbi:alpha/beta fold hydrolase [Cupriavidus metallidurans]|uniref:alpha/beta fold hydrolase n=1 Tax=Cupriavidus metallidurans TaxID=119219 RepID=UPI001CC9007C|nr:alpha/beta fold hydrolase [Cupriavidus metallidurans]UBM12273.1 alpha/beta fold hydrolase [Cupriavidus metallidurans]
MTPVDSAHPEFPPPAPTHFAVQSGPVRLAATAWGDPGHPVVVLVHGYPDNSHVWHGVAQALAGRFRVVAYDVRGAGTSDVPAGVADYRLERLADDFIAVIDAVSPDRPVHLVGHDWGSIQGWEFVTDPRLYGRIASFTSCSGPCLDHAARALREPPRHWGATLRQALASWYIVFFHIPGLPEWNWKLWLGRNWTFWLRRTEGLHTAANPTQTADGVHGLRLYRANIRTRLRHPHNRHAHAPVQVIVPTRDRYVRPAVTEGVGRWAAQAWRRPVDAHHWFPLADPHRMAAMVREFVDHLQGAPASPALQSARVTSEAGKIS